MNRIALLVGNSAYPDEPLRNPVNDAEAVGDALDKLGFRTLITTDATVAIMDDALSIFSAALGANDVALFFFAGHGMQIDDKNFLMATNTNMATETDAKYSSLPLDKVIDFMEKGLNSTDIVMLDACRTNPFERRWRGTSGRGLAPVYAPKGMIVGYATSPGQVASDDIKCIQYDDDYKAIAGIFFEGDNVLYDDEGRSYVDPKSDRFVWHPERDMFKTDLSSAMTVPSTKLSMSFLELAATEKLLVPSTINVQRSAG